MEFVRGKWYICSCNDNLYRYQSNDSERFHSSAIINKNNRTHGGVNPGYNELFNDMHCMEYFNPCNYVSIEEIRKYLPKDYKFENVNNYYFY